MREFENLKMKRIYLLTNFTILTMCLLLFSTCKKEVEIIGNKNKYGTIYGSGGYLNFKGALQLEDNNYLLYGSILSKENGRIDGFILKVDANFNILWDKRYGGVKDDFINSIAVDRDGNIMAGGYSTSFGVSIDSSYIAENSLFYAVYIDKDGNTIWEKTYRANDVVGKTNRHNSAGKVLYLKNNTFCFVGTTGNYTTLIGTKNYYTNDGYAFCINNTGVIKWSKLFYYSPINSIVNYAFDDCYDAALCDDGNIMVQMVNNAYPVTNVNLIKIPYDANGFRTNTYTWISKSITDVVNNYEDGNPCQMEVMKGSSVVFGDMLHSGIAITDDNGNITKHIKFKKDFYNPKITKNKNCLIITGGCETVKDIWPSCWAIIDFDGNIIKEVYPPYSANIVNSIYLNEVFTAPNNEIIAFGSLYTADGTNIIMLRYDENGNLISK